MAEWKKEARRLAKDLCLSKYEIQRIFRRVEEFYAQREMPSFYKGNQKNITEVRNYDNVWCFNRISFNGVWNSKVYSYTLCISKCTFQDTGI